MDETPLQTIRFDQAADIYDNYVTVDFDIPFWLQEAGSVHGKVLELTCGTGRISIPLLKAGVDLSCLDYAPAMLAQLQRKMSESKLSCPVYCQDMSGFTLPDRFDLILIPFHSFSEILDRQKQRSALWHIYDHLNHGGTFICSLHNPVVRTASMDGTLRPVGEFALPNGETLLMRSATRFNARTHIASGEQQYERISADKRVIDRRALEIHFYLFTHEEFSDLIRDVGFEVEALYGDYDRKPYDQATSPFMIWKMQKG